MHEGSESRTDLKGTQSPTHQRTLQIATCQSNEGDSADLQNQETSITTRATQIYLKHKEMGTHPPFVFNTEEADLLVFNFVQSIVQQTEQHMFKQPEQCMQQAYSGLSLGTPIRAKEYTEHFKKNNNTVLLNETKRLDITTDESEWNDDQDQTLHRVSSPQLPPPPGTDNIETTPKTITPSDCPS